MRARVQSEHRSLAEAITEANHVAIGRQRRGTKGRVLVRQWHLPTDGAPIIYRVLIPIGTRGRR